MKLNKAALVSSLGLSVIHFVLVLAGTKFRPDFLNSGDPGAITDKVVSVLTQPGVWAADVMGCITEKPMWWVFLVLNSVLWGHVAALVLRGVSKVFVKEGKSA